MERVRIYRRQGMVGINIYLNKNDYFRHQTEDCDIKVRHKDRVESRPIWLKLEFPIPASVKRESDITKIPDLTYEWDNKRYTAKVRIHPRYIFMEEKAKSYAKTSTYYKDKKDYQEAKKQVARAAHTKDEKYTNYDKNNVKKPFQGGACSPR